MWFSYPDCDIPLYPQKRSRSYPRNKSINRAHNANDRHRRNKVKENDKNQRRLQQLTYKR